MDKLFKGVLDFQREDFEAHRDLFKDLGRRQKPHTLFIGCADSRVVPTLITKTQPGELFMVRNVSNIVPPYDQAEQFYDTLSTIEYAVETLEVNTVLVCGHSNCGGCNALYTDPADLVAMPHLQRWLSLNRDLPRQVQQHQVDGSEAEREWLTEKLNIIQQMKNLLTYPFIRERVEQGDLKLLGWYYIIETGEIQNFNDETGHFEPVSQNP